jgi:N-acyl homoserine lactone hydrolase
MMSRCLSTLLVAQLAAGALSCSGGEPASDAEPAASGAGITSPRLYVFDCGQLRVGDPGRFSLTMDEVSTLELSVPCFLIEHPEGTLFWDAGLSDSLAGESESAQSSGSVARVTTTLRAQLTELGYEPADIDYLAVSHLHYDHAGNANDFAASTWLVQRPEHEAAFSDDPAAFRFDPANYGALETAETLILDGDHDVFGDGAVVIKSAPGHTPGHQVLFVDLAEYGPVVLSGDLYHFPESRSLKRVPTFNFDAEMTLESMDRVEDFLIETGARLWIEHDIAANALLDKSPAYYE